MYETTTDTNTVNAPDALLADLDPAERRAEVGYATATVRNMA